jgi:hypothetical protein
LVIARASLDEIEAILDLVVGLGSFRPEELAKIEAIRDECAKTIFGLIRKVSTSTAPSGTGGVLPLFAWRLGTLLATCL